MNEPAAPASPATPTISATRAASDKGDFAAFDDAALAERRGTPLARVAATPATPPTPEPPAAPAPPAEEPAQPPAADRAVSKRQQQINDYERRIAEQDQRIRALESSLTHPPLERPPTAPAPREPQTWADVVKSPDIDQPMLGEEQFFQQFPDAPYSAYARYAVRYEDRAERANAQQSSEQEQLTIAQHARVEKFVGQLEQARTSDPEFVHKLTPEVRALKPFAALAPGEASGPRNVVAEQIYDSPVAPQVLLHFSQHPEALQRLETVPPEIAAMPPAQRARAHIQWIVKEFGKLEAAFETPAAVQGSPLTPPAVAPPVSAAPPPAPILTRAGSSTDPQAAAFARGDFAAWDRIETEKELQRRGRA